MHGSSLYVCVSVYRCICMDQVYMYKRVFIGVYAWIKFICIWSVYRCICMDQVYMYAQVIHNCMCIHY